MLLLLLAVLTSNSNLAGEPAFDLMGPKVDVRVKRGDVTLPIGEVPSLAPGDRLWVHPDLPETQSARYVLVVAFLRGATNPPPPDWFTRVETWNSDVRDEGVYVNVPAEAQQALLFLAPETGGDFNTLRNTVRGRPGAFVRATQDLQAAGLNRMRLETYLAQVKAVDQTDANLLKQRTELAARSLGIKVNEDCFQKPPDQQAQCLSQLSEGMVMDSANAQSRVDQLASGSTLDLMNQISMSNMAGGGVYSPYVGAIVDTAKILSSLHTAHYQYIPALALPAQDTLNLRLNMPPSFRDPKSVVVIALPPIGVSKSPELYPPQGDESYCLQQPGLVLPTESAPLVYGTHMAYGFNLHIEAKGKAVDLPLKPDPSRGGFVLAGAPPALPAEKDELKAVVEGKWGFGSWTGPTYRLCTNGSSNWTLADGDRSALVVGRDDTLHVEGESTRCVEKVAMKAADGSPVTVTWKEAKAGTLKVVAQMKDAAPGTATLEIYQYGRSDPDKLTAQAYAEAASLEQLTLNSGDPDAVLKGTRLDEVAHAELGALAWTPARLTRVKDLDELTMKANSSTAGLEPGKHYTVNVQLHDGRQLKTQLTVNPPRPQVTLLNKGSQSDAGVAPSPVRLNSPDDLPVNGRIVFFLKSLVPANFPRNETVEVSAVDGSFGTTLSLADGSLVLEDRKTMVGTFKPLARFGPSAFGPLQLRAVAADGTAGQWQPLGTLVREPEFKELLCPRSPAKGCTLSGNDLFLLMAAGSTADLQGATEVPPDFTGTQLTVPPPVDGALYVKLRDDPATAQTLSLPVTWEPMPAPEQTQTAPPQAAPAAAPEGQTETVPAAAPKNSETPPVTAAPAAPKTADKTAPATAPEEAPNAGDKTAPGTLPESKPGTEQQAPAAPPQKQPAQPAKPQPPADSKPAPPSSAGSSQQGVPPVQGAPQTQAPQNPQN